MSAKPVVMTKDMVAKVKRALAFASEQTGALQSPRQRQPRGLKIEFHQHDWIPGFAAFAPGATTPEPDSRAFCALNLGSMLAAVEAKEMPAADIPYFIAESMMHEVIHVIEQWAGVEFSEERVEALLERYRASPSPSSMEAGR